MTGKRIVAKPHRLVMFHVYMLFAFLVLFPKGGIKVGSIPITWGYVFLGATAPFIAVARLLAMPLRARGAALTAMGLMLPIQLVFGSAALFYGIVDVGYGTSMLLSVFVFPALFLLVYPSFFEWINPERASRIFRFCVLAAAIWGILLFFYRFYTGKYIEIPYLTVNAADVGQLDATKHNARSGFAKLISTYNNGNLYGVATLILLPIYNQLEPKRWKRGILLLALLFTLARTVWVGLVIIELVPLAIVLLQNVQSFPVFYPGKTTKRFLAVGAMLVFILFALTLATNSGLSFLLDPGLGGRVNEFPHLSEIILLPSNPLIGFDESVYGSAARFYGWVGLFAIFAMFLSPVIVLLADTSALRSPVRMGAFFGLMLYAMLAASDGAFVLIPVMAFYWFGYTIFVHGWPGVEEQPSGPSHALGMWRRPKLVLETP